MKKISQIFFSKLQNGGLNGDGAINHCFFLLALTQPFFNRIQHINLFKMESIFKMAILRFPISPSEPCIFAIFKHIHLKFCILIKNYIKTNDTCRFLIRIVY
jgi:hypothetical protein